MKTLHYIIAAIALSILPIGATAQTSQLNPVTQAVMNAYQKLIDENPRDYETYLKRANEYYRYNQYLRALNDVDEALKYAPDSETDTRFQALCLRANIYENTGKHEAALEDLNAALSLYPDNYITLYQRANVKYELGQYSEAKLDYQRLYRLNARSLEGLFGMARCAVKENNLGLANEYADQAVATAPSQSDVYTRRASVRHMMGNNTGAVDDLILALSTDNSNNKALKELVNMSDYDYTAVMTGLSNAIRQAPRVGMFYYIRAVIAMSHHRYIAAIGDFKTIVDENLYDHPGLYRSMAECYYALGNYAQASADIEYAIGSTPDNAVFYVTLAKIRRAQWRAEDALDAAEKALAKTPDYAEALAQKALALVDLKRYQEASDAIGEAILNDAETPYYYMVRAWILNDFMNRQGNAATFYERVIGVAGNGNDQSVKSLLGFALLFTGKQTEAFEWMEKSLADNTDHDGLTNYYAACLYAQAGETDKALDCMERSLANGYANAHDWNRDNDARINVGPLRDHPRFTALLEQYKAIF